MALDAGPLFDWARAAGSVYQNQLQRALTTKLGVRWGPDLHHQVDRHWAAVIAACVGADDPLAYGIGQLRHARSTLESDRRAIDAAVPEDRTDQWDQARRQLADVVSQVHQAEELVAQSQARLQDARGRRWGRHDQNAVADAQAQLAAAERRAQKATSAERDLRERLAALAEHQQQRQQRLADVAVPRQEIGTTLAQVDAALDRTRPDRVAALADDPPDHLVARIGPVPATLAGRAVWCHHALDIEAAFDRNDGAIPPWTGWSPQTDLARCQIAIADRVLQASSERPGPPNGPSSPNKPARSSTICAEPNGTAPPNSARRANGNNRSPGSTLRPADHSPASAFSTGDFPRVRHHRSPCQRHRRRDGPADRV